MTTIPAALPALAPALIALVVGWRVYQRVRRLVGRQPVRTGRLVATTIFFPIVIVLLALSTLAHPETLAALAGGVAIGAVVARWGLARTTFESVDGALSYVPDAKIGVTVALLFVGRLAYRIGSALFGDGTDPVRFDAFGRSPLTLAIFGLVAAYFSGYALGILRWSRSAGRAIAAPVPTPARDA